MVELKPLISRLNRLAKCQSNQFSTEAQQKHMINVVGFFSKCRLENPDFEIKSIDFVAYIFTFILPLKRSALHIFHINEFSISCV